MKSTDLFTSHLPSKGLISKVGCHNWPSITLSSLTLSRTYLALAFTCSHSYPLLHPDVRPRVGGSLLLYRPGSIYLSTGWGRHPNTCKIAERACLRMLGFHSFSSCFISPFLKSWSVLTVSILLPILLETQEHSHTYLTSCWFHSAFSCVHQTYQYSLIFIQKFTRLLNFSPCRPLRI